ncbi:MAG: hypothetical protein QM820_61570 [Minicystis sp.]
MIARRLALTWITALSLFALTGATACKPTGGTGGTGGEGAGGSGGTGGESSSSGVCKGTFNGAVSGTIACDPAMVIYDPSANHTNVLFGGTATGPAVEPYWALSIVVPGHPLVKPYGQSGLEQLDSQIITNDPANAVSYGSHWDASSPSGTEGNVALAFSSASDSSVHGQADITYADTTNGSPKTVILHLTF